MSKPTKQGDCITPSLETIRHFRNDPARSAGVFFALNFSTKGRTTQRRRSKPWLFPCLSSSEWFSREAQRHFIQKCRPNYSAYLLFCVAPAGMASIGLRNVVALTPETPGPAFSRQRRAKRRIPTKQLARNQSKTHGKLFGPIGRRARLLPPR